MVWARRCWIRLQGLLLRGRNAQQLHDEIQFHLEQQIAENLGAGMSREIAKDLRYGLRLLATLFVSMEWQMSRATQLPTTIRTTIRNLNPDLVVDNIKTASELVTDTLISQLLMAELSTFFGGLVLLLVCVGLYGSMTYSVARRTREIGVRMALGAPREGLIWMVTREACIELAIGGPIGIAAAVAATRVFEASSSVSARQIPFRWPRRSWLLRASAWPLPSFRYAGQCASTR
jgi:hypothetical protein